MRNPVTPGRFAALALALVVAGCGKRETAQQAPPKPPAMPGSGAASGAAGSDTGATYAPLGKRPVNPRRATPPPELSGHALAVGATAPAIALAGTTGAFDLANALSDKQRRVLLVFYRGDW